MKARSQGCWLLEAGQMWNGLSTGTSVALEPIPSLQLGEQQGARVVFFSGAQSVIVCYIDSQSERGPPGYTEYFTSLTQVFIFYFQKLGTTKALGSPDLRSLESLLFEGPGLMPCHLLLKLVFGMCDFNILSQHAPAWSWASAPHCLGLQC